MQNSNTVEHNTLINSLARHFPRPKDRRGRPAKGNEMRPILEANRDGIAKLRQRKFTFGQITEALNAVGNKVSYQSVYQFIKGGY